MEEVAYDVTFPPYAIDGYIVHVQGEGHVLLGLDNKTRGDVEFVGKRGVKCVYVCKYVSTYVCMYAGMCVCM